MKWFKHISDSLDDPFIYELMDRFGDFGYLAFFGILEIYAREFKAEPGWKLVTTLSFLRSKLHQTSVKRVSNFIQSDFILKKWQTKVEDKTVTIFIPKFTEFIDEWTQRKLNKKYVKLGSCSGVTPKILKHEAEEEVDIDNTPLPPKEKNTTPAKKIKEEYPEDFEKFWSVYPNKKSGKSNAFISWKKLNGRRPPVEQITAAIEKQKSSTDWTKDNGQFIPMATTWLNQKRWDAVMDIQVQPAAPKTSTIEEIRALKSIRG